MVTRPHMKRAIAFLAFAAALSAQSCMSGKLDDIPAPPALSSRLGFDITVTREGIPVTKGEMVDAADLAASMDPSRPFSLIAIDEDTESLLLDNMPVYSGSDGNYSTFLEGGILKIPTQILFSAYYPHIHHVNYGDSYHSYSIPFKADETDAGPLVSKTVERCIQELNTLPLEFRHITNDVGFRICDITPAPEIQGLIRLRKLIAHNVASAGVYLNDLVLGRGDWSYQEYYRDVVVFEGDAPVGVGSANELFVGQDALVEQMSQSKRFYAIPDEVLMGRQYVEAIFDVDSFTLNGFTYPPLKDQVTKFPIYGVLPDNVMVPGKQYTFHLGLNLGTIYQEITFTASVSSWQTMIYENNHDF